MRWPLWKRDGAAGSPAGTFTLACVVDRHPRFHVELILWALCARAHLPESRFDPVVYFVDAAPPDLVEWLRRQRIEVRSTPTLIAASPHCNKIAPFAERHDGAVTLVADADLFFVEDFSGLLRSARFRAPPNNHCNPPPAVFRTVLAAAGVGDYRPGLALYRGAGGIRETHVNNISAGLVAAPPSRSRELAAAWLKWARWVVEHRHLLDRWAVHVDQIAFALAMEDMKEDVELLPAQTNAVLHLLAEVETVYGFHLTTGHIPRFPERFNADRTLSADGVAGGVAAAIGRLNDCIAEAVGVIAALPSTRDHMEMFLNPGWRR